MSYWSTNHVDRSSCYLRFFPWVLVMGPFDSGGVYSMGPYLGVLQHISIVGMHLGSRA